ncbi:diguanylate cyclase (GGDEF) domain-containing protein [Burkholderiales bacterium JOSHI_001]|nr:diguanylate cyclase (GGDEF) domain-containing protein [Burkholderiales bacterium JOSHI_001]
MRAASLGVQLFVWLTAGLGGLSGAALAAGPSPAAQVDPSFTTRLAEARRAAAALPERGLAQLRALRAGPLVQGRLAARLVVDEAECRVLSDIDALLAISVADAGLALVTGGVNQSEHAPWLRLRACRAGMLLSEGRRQEGLTELEAVLEAQAGATDASAVALARLERGLYRSRQGDLDAGQKDLLEACAALKPLGNVRDLNLCLGHLANHYKRVGDTDEALRLLMPLRDAARHDGADFDDAVYTFGMAQVLQRQSRWDEALVAYRETSQAHERLQDRIGQGYSEHGIAQVLLKQGQPALALRHVERALALVDRPSDPGQYELIVVLQAELLQALGRPQAALACLDEVEGAVRQRQSLPAMADWMRVRAQTMRALGHWREAYDALTEARDLEARLQAQQLSEQSARWRMQFNRARDAEELSNLRRLYEQGQQLRRMQALALGLGVLLLAGLVVLALRKVRQARLLQAQASTDELTGLPNRRAVMAYVAQELQRARRPGGAMSLLLVDVDFFKRVNDTHGHPVGDAVLRHMARMLGEDLRERDRVGRIGGEEFVVVLPGAGLRDAQQVAERMRKRIAASPLQLDALSVPFTISIGVAQAMPTGTVEGLVEQADGALYRAKGSGRNRVMLCGAMAEH